MLLLGFVAALGYAGWALLGRSQADAAAYPTQTLVQVDIVDEVVATGSILPREEVALKPRVAGVITELYVDPGDHVVKGQKIAKVEVVADEASVAQLQSRVRAAKLAVADARRDLEQIEGLTASGVIAADDARRARLDLQLAQEELRAAREGLLAVREGAVRQTETAANMVVATIAGTVLSVPVRVGTSVVDSNSFNEGTTVATVADMSDLVFVGWVDESDVGRLSAKMPLTLRVGALDELELKGAVERIAPKGEARQGITQFEVRAAVDAPPGRTLRAGYSANAHIVIQRRSEVWAIPEKLLQFDNDTPYVEILVGGEPPRFERRNVELGLSDGIHAEVLEGLDPEDQVRIPGTARPNS